MRIAILLLLLAGTVRAEQVRVYNANQEPVAFWIWDDGTRLWNQPTVIQPAATVVVTLPGNQRRYLAASDFNGRQCSLGWINATKLLQRNPTATLVVRLMQEKVTVPKTETIWKPVYEQRTYQIPVRSLEWIDGTWCWVEKIMTRTYTVRRDVPEQRTVMVEVARDRLGWVAYDDNGEYQCRITFRTADPGAFIRYKPVASPDPASTSKQATEVEEILNIGYYAMWCERMINGKLERTSDDKLQDVYGDEVIVIPEKKEG